MGSGIWTKDALATYTVSARGCSLDDFTTMNVSTQDVYKATKLNKLLDPLRQCASAEIMMNILIRCLLFLR